VSSYAALASRLQGRQDKARVFYLAVGPDLYGPICTCLQQAGVVTGRSRVVLEKPIGYDLPSSRRINDMVGAVLREEQIFRIDHYLGKETVQNLLVMRFANALFEPLWRSSHVDHVQITVAETLGVQGRTAYYDSSGALRDMIQNHMLQLLCLVAMEPPGQLEADAIRDEKMKVLKALRPIEEGGVPGCVVRGQYRRGAVDGHSVRGYLEELRDELGQDRQSGTETFVALKAEVQNWRWTGVPFYLRTGKRMPARCSDIVVQLRGVPHVLFSEAGGSIQPNRLVIRLQPDEGIKLQLMHKVPGPGTVQLRSAPLNVSFAETFNTRSPDAYERLLGDVVRGNPTLFMRRDEVDAAWGFVEPIHSGWSRSSEGPRGYTAGTWGPSAAIALIERDGRTWYEDSL
jgi:glucose-6-phosphate 1-dehydrogenase